MFFKEAQALQAYMQEIRRELHRQPEVGLDLPLTKSLVKGRLEDLGLEVKELGSSGLTALIKGDKEGNGSAKTLLLRADMDALPMQEETGLEFASTNENAHACGHDLHTAMLLGAARILVENKEQFSGTIKLMFQPAEEVFKGAKMMIAEGVLENPKVDAAFALHTELVEGPGSLMYMKGHMTTSCDNFKITIRGKGAHGAYPHTSIDPINAGVNIYQNFSELISRENPPQAVTTLTFGQFTAGSSSNVIPDSCIMQGTMRTYEPEVRAKLKRRMEEIIAGVAETTGTKIELDFFSGVPSLYSDPDLTQKFVEILEVNLPELNLIGGHQIMASEDMADVAERVPTSYMMLNCQVEGLAGLSHHNPKVQFAEEAMPFGCAAFATLAVKYLDG